MNQQSKETNPILWFLFAVVIPMVIALILTAIVLSAAGVNVSGWVQKATQNIPVLSTFIQTDEEKDAQDMIRKLESKIDEKDQEILELERLNEEMEFMIDHLEDELEQLEKSLVEVEELADEQEQGEHQSKETFQEFSVSFAEMDKRKAALIISELDDDISIAILNELSSEERGDILGAMESEKAAHLTELYVRKYANEIDF